MISEEPSLGDLVVGLTDDISTLVRREVDLAKAEFQEGIKDGAQAGGMIAAGGMVAYAGLLLILAAVAILLGDWWDNYWLGAAVVGLLTGIIGWAVLNGGLKQLKEISLVPHKTLQSLERDAKMAKEKLS
jgi:drug/metabolite transporter (DMT)-like permease